MNILESKTYQNDLQKIVERYEFDDLKGKSVLVTGASGLICSAVVDLLITYNRICNANVTIYVAGRDMQKLHARFQCEKNAYVICVYYDALKELEFSFDVDYIIHGASNASPNLYVNEPVDTMMSNIIGIYHLLDFAKQNKTKRVLYISSSEVYGNFLSDKPLTEECYGSVDVMSVRSSYSMGKRAAETLCVSYASQYSVDVNIVRPGHIYGPTLSKLDNRVSSQFLRLAAEGADLVMKSAGNQIRSYCYCLDCASAILYVLLKGECSKAYNISNRNSIISIKKMAEIISSCSNSKLFFEFPTDNDKVAFNPMDNSSLDSRKIEELGWNGVFDSQLGFYNSIKILKEINSN